MSVFSSFNKIKDALDDAIHDDQKETPTGHKKTQDEEKVNENQKKSGWRDKVGSLSLDWSISPCCI